MVQQKSGGKNNFEFLSKADWLDLNGPLDFSYGDVENNVFVECPAMLNNGILSSIRNFLFGRNSYHLSGMLSPNTIIGRYCSLSHNVSIGSTNHNMRYLSTGILTVDMSELTDNYVSEEYTIVGCDVWMGVNVTVLAGNHIGHGAVIGANSVVTKDIPPYAVAVGTPARVIKYRFEEDVIKELLQLEWWKLEPNFISNLPKEDIGKSIEMIKKHKLKID
ncbi:MAG: CatB-related O-acetyltransferase [Bacillota bacterium]|nr:CatB-related O-acetyltransferase [Bacillota bacterium]